MGQQTDRQRARRQALDAAAAARAKRVERDRRLERLVVLVLTALAERDVAVRDAEQRAGAALHAMTHAEGLTLREAAAWCGEGVTLRDVTRLRQLTHPTQTGDHLEPGIHHVESSPPRSPGSPG